MENNDSSLDLTGIGKLAKAIPDEVYCRTSDTINTSFEKLVSPITEYTSGLGRLIRQKFDNKTAIEQSLLTYALQNAHSKIITKRVPRKPTPNAKILIKIIDEVSIETDELLHNLWTNLLCTELTDSNSHPFFVNILSSLSKEEAILLDSLLPLSEVGEVKHNISFTLPRIKHWARQTGGSEFEWGFSQNVLSEYGLAHFIAPATHVFKQTNTVILYKTDLAEEFLKAVKFE